MKRMRGAGAGDSSSDDDDAVAPLGGYALRRHKAARGVRTSPCVLLLRHAVFSCCLWCMMWAVDWPSTATRWGAVWRGGSHCKHPIRGYPLSGGCTRTSSPLWTPDPNSSEGSLLQFVQAAAAGYARRTCRM